MRQPIQGTIAENCQTKFPQTDGIHDGTDTDPYLSPQTAMSAELSSPHHTNR